MIIWPISNLPIEPDDSLIIVTKRGDDLEPIRSAWLQRIPCEITFVEMESLSEGPASTVEATFGELDLELPMVVLNSDQYVNSTLTDYIEHLRNSSDQDFGSIVTMFATGTKWSYIGRNIDGGIERVVEKQQISSEATVGIYGWTRAQLFVDSLESMKRADFRINNEFYVAPTFNYLIDKGIKIVTFDVGSVGQSVHGLGTPEDFSKFLTSEVFRSSLTSIKRSFLPQNVNT